ncbi:hypothetical protein [Buttiauxella massiliensis]|uniref:hypothetical protein n=1 Tax=Buttiauxella massiliensis TaxID=2831590 RepID=UPI00125FE015|nr:hypothetical protein [Buttiauxella massiliensis]
MNAPESKKKNRSSIGKIMLWLFYLFCIYAAFCLFNTLLSVSHVDVIAGQESAFRFGETVAVIGESAGLLLVGAILGLLAWITRAK